MTTVSALRSINNVCQLCKTSSHKARNDFIRTIHHTMHDNVYHMPPPPPASAAAAVTSQVMSAVSRQQQQQQPQRHDREPSVPLSGAASTSGKLSTDFLNTHSENFWGQS